MSERHLYLLEEVTKSYGTAQALNIDRLEILPGEILCLVGPTGSGKSTLLRLLSGIEEPTSGKLWHRKGLLNGQGLPVEVLRSISLVFQRPLMLQGTVRANAGYGLKLRGLDSYSANVRQILDFLGLGGLTERSAKTLSGGETQLVALTRALVLEPEVLLLDEPTANLDPARVGLVEKLIEQVCRRRPTTVVWATHNIFQARRMARRVAFLLDGRLVEVAATKEFFEAPRDQRTAAFIRGEMVY